MNPSSYFYARAEIPSTGFGPIVVDCRLARRTIVHLDLYKVITDPNWYPRSSKVRSYRHDLPFNGDESRIRQLIELVRAKRALPPVEAFLNSRRDGVCYPDGRHRSMLLHAAGYNSIPAEVPPEDADVVQRLVGCEQPDAQIRVLLPTPQKP